MLHHFSLGLGWSFSRCHSCQGLALIRQTEVHVIKVDKVPLGERILAPQKGLPEECAFGDPIPYGAINRELAPPLQGSTETTPLVGAPSVVRRALTHTWLRGLMTGTLGLSAALVGIFGVLRMTHQHSFIPSRAEFESLILGSGTPKSPMPSSFTVRVRQDHTALYARPALEARVLGEHRANVLLRVINWQGQWFEVQSVDPAVGWSQPAWLPMQSVIRIATDGSP